MEDVAQCFSLYASGISKCESEPLDFKHALHALLLEHGVKGAEAETLLQYVK